MEIVIIKIILKYWILFWLNNIKTLVQINNMNIDVEKSYDIINIIINNNYLIIHRSVYIFYKIFLIYN